jgi:acyl carrier protein
MTLGDLRQRLVDILLERRSGALPEHELAAEIDSLEHLLIIEAIEEWVGSSIPAKELNQSNFDNIETLVALAARLKGVADEPR